MIVKPKSALEVSALVAENKKYCAFVFRCEYCEHVARIIKQIEISGAAIAIIQIKSHIPRVSASSQVWCKNL